MGTTNPDKTQDEQTQVQITETAITKETRDWAALHQRVYARARNLIKSKPPHIRSRFPTLATSEQLEAILQTELHQAQAQEQAALLASLAPPDGTTDLEDTTTNPEAPSPEPTSTWIGSEEIAATAKRIHDSARAQKRTEKQAAALKKKSVDGKGPRKPLAVQELLQSTNDQLQEPSTDPTEEAPPAPPALDMAAANHRRAQQLVEEHIRKQNEQLSDNSLSKSTV